MTTSYDPATTKITPRSFVEAVSFVDFPAKHRISNFHIWSIFAADFFFVHNSFTPNFIKKTESGWVPYSVLLEFLAKYKREYNSFKGIVNPVTKYSLDLDELISYGKGLDQEYQALTETIRCDIEVFLSESKIQKWTKKWDDEFNVWYANKFELTSSVHRNAYIQMVRDKPKLASVSILLMLIPLKEKILATYNDPSSSPSSLPTAPVDHAHVYTLHSRSGTLVCSCGHVLYIDPEDNLINESRY